KLADGVPISEAAAFGVAAADDEVGPRLEAGDELRQQFGGMLEVGIHDSNDGGAGVGPAVQNRPGEATLSFSDEEAHTPVLLSDGGNDLLGSIAAVVIDDQDLVINAQRVEGGPDPVEEHGNVAGLTQGGYDKSQFLEGRPGPDRARASCRVETDPGR